jgi:hypothetical protein
MATNTQQSIDKIIKKSGLSNTKQKTIPKLIARLNNAVTKSGSQALCLIITDAGELITYTTSPDATDLKVISNNLIQMMETILPARCDMDGLIKTYKIYNPQNSDPSLINQENPEPEFLNVVKNDN